jgi:hypothetical protein
MVGKMHDIEDSELRINGSKAAGIMAKYSTSFAMLKVAGCPS